MDSNVVQNNSQVGTSVSGEVKNYEIGDLVWAKFPGSPYWPSIITEDTGINEFVRTKMVKNNYKLMTYHVTFFGDKMSHYWIPAKDLLPLTRSSLFPKEVFFWDNQYDKNYDSRLQQCTMLLWGKSGIFTAFELPKTAILNKKFYHSINEVRYFLKEDLLNNRLHLLDILNNSYKKYVNFEGFQTVLPEPKPKAKPNNSFDSQNGQELLRQNNWLKVCCKCLTTRGDLLKCNGSCNGYYHLSCESTDSLETNVIDDEKPPNTFELNYKCESCLLETKKCNICNRHEEYGIDKLLKCSAPRCDKTYHSECIAQNPLTQYLCSNYAAVRNFYCSEHVCYTCCFMNDTFDSLSGFLHNRLITCVKCPSSYHRSNFCIPVGSIILSANSVICPKHYDFSAQKNYDSYVRNSSLNLNMNWCLLCSQGGDLIYCETCPNSFHLDCLENSQPKGKYHCSDCENHRLPLYGEIVWAKYHINQWWPGRILFPNEVPKKLIRDRKRHLNEFAVQLYSLNTAYWFCSKLVFPFHENDGDHDYNLDDKDNDNSITEDGEKFKEAVRLAGEEHLKFQAKWTLHKTQIKNSVKPPLIYTKIKTNFMYCNARLNYDNGLKDMCVLPCDCDAKSSDPCGPGTNCINRALKTECDTKVCPAGEQCQNQEFDRPHPLVNLVPFLTDSRGWGLKSTTKLEKGDFVIEYVGEVIDMKEYQRRLAIKMQHNDNNYYFLTMDSNRIIDAGPRGNLSRFVNHSCQPNCELQKWIVKNEIRAGLFAIEDIESDTELTFNYNLECLGSSKQICFCGSRSCFGFIDGKNKNTKICELCSKKMTESYICSVKDCNKKLHKSCSGSHLTTNEDNWVCSSHKCNECNNSANIKCQICNHIVCNSHLPVEFNSKPEKYLCFKHQFDVDISETHLVEADTTIKMEIDENISEKSDNIVPKKLQKRANSKSSISRNTNLRKKKNSGVKQMIIRSKRTVKTSASVSRVSRSLTNDPLTQSCSTAINAIKRKTFSVYRRPLNPERTPGIREHC